jgi:hypothetical protein
LPAARDNGRGAARRTAPVFRFPERQRRVVLDTNVLVSLYVFADSRLAPLARADRIGAPGWRLCE